MVARKEAMKKISITIEADDHRWLQAHKEINVSGLVQKCIKDLRSRYKD